MASQRGHQVKHLRLLALLVFVGLAAAITRRMLLKSSSDTFSFQEGHQPNPKLVRIHGRWEAVRASLGLPPLPHTIPATSKITQPHHSEKLASRFDLRRKRAEQASRPYPPLHFAQRSIP
ncbi:hypothetical protein PAXRUDRAFT_11136 [Paxillus rubicundulus Ve08.2h10]|uniref:Uncharacterized protein n=1 Tax=Paxillus rubicundulus Ve08.2h10 TaxID=930991 RepID=A0A0D0E4C2_9AGAM|nr:hypothetical protein PAXRUDRAFT_11136 [Paxillus rubicundulus Ve08.2h10]